MRHEKGEEPFCLYFLILHFSVLHSSFPQTRSASYILNPKVSNICPTLLLISANVLALSASR